MVRFRLQGAFNENRQFRLEQRPTGRAKSTDFEWWKPGASPRFCEHRKATLAIKANTEKFALALLSLEILGIARSMSNLTERARGRDQ